MPLLTETGSKRFTIAEGFFETGVSENLCKLFISELRDFTVYSLYNDLSNKLLAYKLIRRNDELEEPWLSAPFLKTIRVDFNPDTEIIPDKFSEVQSNGGDGDSISVHPPSANGYMHYAKGLFKYNAFLDDNLKVYLFRQDLNLVIYIFEGRKCCFSNTFVCQNETEMLYFILSSLELSGNSQDNAAVYLDYYLASDPEFTRFIRQYFRSVKNMKPLMADPDPEIPFLSELLFPNYLLSLCV